MVMSELRKMKISYQKTFSFPRVHFGMENCVGCVRRDAVNKVFDIISFNLN